MTEAAKSRPRQSPGDVLLAAGWTPLGDPSWENCRWLDPELPEVDSYRREPILCDQVVLTTVKDERGHPIEVQTTERRPVLVRGGDGSDGSPWIPAERVVFTAAREPVGFDAALMTHFDRERRAKLQADRKARGG